MGKPNATNYIFALMGHSKNWTEDEWQFQLRRAWKQMEAAAFYHDLLMEGYYLNVYTALRLRYDLKHHPMN